MAADPIRHEQEPPAGQTNPPAFNVPGVVLATIATLAALHAVRMFVLSPSADLEALLDFSFISGCYEESGDICSLRPTLALLWSPISHAFLHGDWTHLAANGLWLLAFGTPVARRLGSLRFLAFALAGALAGAALFFVLNPLLLQPMIGASGSVSALMGGASRFALGSLGRLTSSDVAHSRRLTIRECLTDRTIVFFVVIFFATNLFLGSSFAGLFGGVEVAWEAHLGGFAFGFLLFAPFDRRLGASAP